MSSTLTPDVFDLDALAFSDSYEHIVNHPRTGLPTSLVIVLSGPGHPQTLAAEELERRDIYDRRERRQTELEAAAKAGRTLPPERETVQESLVRNAAALARRVVTSSPLMFEGKTITLLPDNAASVFSSPKFGWVYEDLFSASQNKINFIKLSA